MSVHCDIKSLWFRICNPSKMEINIQTIKGTRPTLALFALLTSVALIIFISDEGNQASKSNYGSKGEEHSLEKRNQKFKPKSAPQKVPLEERFKIHGFNYDDWKVWVEMDGNNIFCRSNSDCTWISSQLKCQNKTKKLVTASWFGIGRSQKLGECSCPKVFNHGFNWKTRKCESSREQWVIILSSVAVCLVLTLFIILFAFNQEILVRLGLKNRRLSTPVNSSIRSNSGSFRYKRQSSHHSHHM